MPFISEVTPCHLHGTVLVTETSPASMWEGSTYEHEYQEVRTINLILEASYHHNVPYQSIAGHNRHPILSVYNHPSPNPSHSLAVVLQLLVFLLAFFLSLPQRSFTNFLPLKLELSLTLLALFLK